MGEPIEVCPLVGVAIVGVVFYMDGISLILQVCLEVLGGGGAWGCLYHYICSFLWRGGFWGLNHFLWWPGDCTISCDGLGTAPSLCAPSLWWPGDCIISCGGLGTATSHVVWPGDCTISGQNGFCVCVLVRLIKSREGVEREGRRGGRGRRGREKRLGGTDVTKATLT